jgi:hypothetical protein
MGRRGVDAWLPCADGSELTGGSVGCSDCPPSFAGDPGLPTSFVALGGEDPAGSLDPLHAGQIAMCARLWIDDDVSIASGCRCATQEVIECS